MATWNAIDNFEAGADQALNGWNGGSNWNAAWGVVTGGSYSDFGIDTVSTIQGARSVHIQCTTTQCYIQRNMPAAQSVGILYFAIRAAQADRPMYIYFTNAGGSGITAVRMGADGNISIFTPTYVAVSAYSINTWYYVDFEWDETNHAGKSRMRVGTGGVWGTYTDWIGLSGSLTGFQIECDAINGSVFWLDDIRITDPYLAVTNIASFDGLAYASTKSVDSLALASMKSFNSLT